MSLVGFYFKVEFRLLAGFFDVPFAEVSGLSESIEFEELEEGGEFRYKHQLPKRRKHSNLICKRALVPLMESPLSIWICGILESDFSTPIIPIDATVSIMDEEGGKAASWYFSNLYPVKWELSALDAKKNDLAIETIEFAYNTIRRIP